MIRVIGTSAPKKPGRLRRRLPIHRRVDRCWKLRPHMSGWQNGQSITRSGRLIAYVDNLPGGSVPPHSVSGSDPIAHRAQEVSELERLRQMELTIGFEFRHLRVVTRHEKK